MKNRAVFLDRDGTIIEDIGYINSPSQIVFYSNVYQALKLLKDEGFILIIITNQSGIAKGALSFEEVKMVNTAISERFASEGIDIAKIYVCPHAAEENCLCRKPSPFFLHEAKEEFDINLSNSFFIGDHPSDILCASRTGVTGIYVLTGHGVKHYHELNSKPIIKANILDAAKYINSLYEITYE